MTTAKSKDLQDRLYDLAWERTKSHAGAERWLQERATFYGRMADRHRNTPYHSGWWRVYQAYAGAANEHGYWFDVECGLFETHNDLDISS